MCREAWYYGDPLLVLCVHRTSRHMLDELANNQIGTAEIEYCTYYRKTLSGFFFLSLIKTHKRLKYARVLFGQGKTSVHGTFSACIYTPLTKQQTDRQLIIKKTLIIGVN